MTEITATRAIGDTDTRRAARQTLPNSRRRHTHTGTCTNVTRPCRYIVRSREHRRADLSCDIEGAERISRGLITLRGSTLGEEAWDVSLKAAGHVHAACLGAGKASRRAADRRANQVLLSIVHRHRRGVAATTKRANFRSGHGHLLVLDGRRPHQQEVLLGGLSSFGL